MKEIKVNKDVVLRHIKLSDAKLFFDAEQDVLAKKNFMRTPSKLQEVIDDCKDDIKEYRRKKPSAEKFSIIYKGDLAGWIRINSLNILHHEHKGKVDLCLHKDFRGKGIMTSVLKKIVSYAFKTYKLRRLEAWTRLHNNATQKLNESAGFKLEGVLRKNKCKNGKFLDDTLWAVVR